MNYYLVSKKNTYEEDAAITLWRPDCKGYTYFLDAAGLYSEELIKTNLSYYNNGYSTIAIPSFIIKLIPIVEILRDEKIQKVLPNEDEMWDAITEYYESNVCLR